MGRTEPTFRNLLDRIEAEWRDYRRGLSAREQDAFDGLFQKARAHASASSNVCRVDPLESVLLSMLLEHELELRTLRAQVALLSRAAASHADGAEVGRGRGEGEDPPRADSAISAPSA